MPLKKRRKRLKPVRIASIFARTLKRKLDEKREDRALRQKFAESPQGQLLQEAERLGRMSGADARRKAENLSRRIEEMQRNGLTSNSDITSLLEEIGGQSDRAARSGFLNMLLRPFGPVGRFVGEMLGSQTRWSTEQVNDALGAAVNLLGAMNPDLVEGGDNRTPEQRGMSPVDDAGLSAQVPPGSQVGDQHTDTAIQINIKGERITVAADDPIVTGKMIPVKTSSNVHSIGYRINWANPDRSAVLVRFLGPGSPRRGPGPLYEYIGVPPMAFREAAAIAQSGSHGTGVWVWDTLRIRGSQVAHNYEYHLIGIANGHVPRRAGYKNGQEWWLERTATINAGPRRGKVLRSAPARPISFRPSSGRPSNGRPGG